MYNTKKKKKYNIQNEKKPKQNDDYVNVLLAISWVMLTYVLPFPLHLY